VSASAPLLERLPGSLEWAVLFRLPRLLALAPQASDIRAAFALGNRDLADVTHVVLTSEGSWLGCAGRLHGYANGTAPTAASESLAERFAPLLARIDVEGADCVGLGQVMGEEPVAMAVWLGEDGEGRAEAWFSGDGSHDSWELLGAVGVHPTASSELNGLRRVQFSYSLRTHLEAARRAGFARTANCNRFFLGHGRLDERLTSGLEADIHARIDHAAEQAYERALALAEAELATGLAPMTADDGKRRFSYGDLVPLGLLLAGLRRPPTMALLDRALPVIAGLEQRLRDERRDGGWPFHRGTITTGLDSAFVLLGLRDADGIEALERFRTADGGYGADRRADAAGPSTVAHDPATTHWAAPDLATTALVQAIRREAGLEPTTPEGWFEDRFEARASAFIARPWLLDWLVALALDDGALRERLRKEVLASRNGNWTFGRPDERVLGTACAALALAATGERGRPLALAQVALAGVLANDERPVVPFMSTVECAGTPDDVRRLLAGRGVTAAGGRMFAVTTYEDTSGAIRAGLASLALSRRADVPSGREVP